MKVHEEGRVQREVLFLEQNVLPIGGSDWVLRAGGLSAIVQEMKRWMTTAVMRSLLSWSLD